MDRQYSTKSNVAKNHAFWGAVSDIREEIGLAAFLLPRACARLIASAKFAQLYAE